MTLVKCPTCGTAIHVAEKRSGLWWGLGCLIAALAIPMVVAVIGLLAAIAIPSFVKARETSQLAGCLNNLSALEAAKEQAALDLTRNPGDATTELDVNPHLPRPFAQITCPKGGTYALHAIGEDVACSVHGSLSDAEAMRRSGRVTPQAGN
jgi:hypothetical protein